MTGDDTRTEALVRDALRHHDQPHTGATTRLLAAVRAGVADSSGRRRTRLAWAGAVVAVVVIAGAVPAAVALLRGGTPPPVPTQPGRPLGAPPEGWRWESSLGLVAAVPQDWVINDFACGQSARPSVVRGGGVWPACFTPEPATKELVIFEAYDPPVPISTVLESALLDPTTTGQEYVLDGVAAQRFSGVLDDGRHAAAVVVPHRNTALIVRTFSALRTAAILASLRVVDTDHLGCTVTRPEVTPPAVTGETFVDPAPVSIGLCYYSSAMDIDARQVALGASGELTGEAAVALAALINAAPPGRNPDAPNEFCPQRAPGPPDAVLRVHSAGGLVTLVWASWSGCTGRGLTDGASEVGVNQRIVAAIMAPLGINWGFSDTLPE